MVATGKLTLGLPLEADIVITAYVDSLLLLWVLFSQGMRWDYFLSGVNFVWESLECCPTLWVFRACHFKYERGSPRLSQILFHCLHVVISKNISSSPKINMFQGRSLSNLTLFYLRMNFLSFREFGENIAELDGKFQSSSFAPSFSKDFHVGLNTGKTLGNHVATSICVAVHR